MNPQPSAPAHRNFRAAAQDTIAQRSSNGRGWIVGVIANQMALNKAQRLRRPPDLFEIRLDAFPDRLKEIDRALPYLGAPLILTARHPAEGGCHSLPAAARRALLGRFLEQAAWIDLELRSLSQMKPLLERAHRNNIGVILSRHDFDTTPSATKLKQALETAITAGADIFKIVTRTDNAPQLHRLLTFVEENGSTFPIAAMGVGARGGESRRLLLRLGSALHYGALDQANVPGQLTLRQLRRARLAYTI